MIRPKQSQLANVLLGNNPSPTAKTGWSKVSGREFDLLSFDYGPGDWSIACNQKLIGPGTVGWIYRSDGSFGHLAGLIIFDGVPLPQTEPGGAVDYCSGMLWRLPREWWVDGARIASRGWPAKRAPFGTRTRRFRNGESLSEVEEAVLWNELHEVARDWLLANVALHPARPTM
jgi:hypothetical protein